MKRYTRILICPKTGKEVSTKGHFYNHGVCEVCGHKTLSTICHAEREVGHWVYPVNHKWWKFWNQPHWVPKDA